MFALTPLWQTHTPLPYMGLLEPTQKKISMSIHTQVIQQAYFPSKSYRKIFQMPCIFFI